MIRSRAADFLGWVWGPWRGETKKTGSGFSAEVVTQDVEGIEGVAEGAGDVFGGPALDQVSAQGLVLAVFGQAGFEEEAAECT